MAAADHRKLAIELFNHTWTLMDLESRTVEQTDEMLHSAHASTYHWLQVGEPINQARGPWRISRAYTLTRRFEPVLYHVQQCLDICKQIDARDWDRAFAWEALARAHSINGDRIRTLENIKLAQTTPIEKKEDRELLEADLATIIIPD